MTTFSRRANSSRTSSSRTGSSRAPVVAALAALTFLGAGLVLCAGDGGCLSQIAAADAGATSTNLALDGSHVEGKNRSAAAFVMIF